jgi:hypothetical protein
MTVQRTEPRPGAEARRALVLLDRPLVVDLIELTLNHGVFVVQAARARRDRAARLRVVRGAPGSETPALRLRR